MNILMESEWSRPFCRAVWTEPLPTEEGAPAHRIIHSCNSDFAAPVRIHRLGLRLGSGYFKCGSHSETDWIKDCRLLVRHNESWSEALYVRNQGKPDAADSAAGEETPIQWFDLSSQELVTTSVSIEIRRSGVDEWWTPWNLAMTGMVLEGELEGEPDGEPASDALRKESSSLQTAAVLSLDDMPAGVSVELKGSEVHYKSRYLEAGFDLNYPAFTFLSVDEQGLGNTQNNILQLEEISGPLGRYALQGYDLQQIGEAKAYNSRTAVRGETQVQGNRVIYEYSVDDSGQKLRLEWTVLEDRLVLKVAREGERPLHTRQSCIWRLAFDSRVTPTGVLGTITHAGETGLVRAPALLHAPRFGTFTIQSLSGAISLRSDSIRPAYTTILEVKVGEEAQPEGDYLLTPGHHDAEVEFKIGTPDSAVGSIPLDQLPADVKGALAKCVLTALPYRPDTATFSNNFNSMHAPLCMDNWSALAIRFGQLLPGLHAADLLRDTLERWLDGGPGYACGPTSQSSHALEDEYLMTGVASLLGLAEYLQFAGDPQWVERYSKQIKQQLASMLDRDLDGDGLVESPYRLGISGQHQWSTNWWDIISFGWKDAFVNALLYPALRLLTEALPRLGQPALAAGLDDWADRLQANYVPTFFNPETGWLAGWVCKEGRLHDYAFLFVNGAAIHAGLVNHDLGREIMKRLWDELSGMGLHDYRMGLPGNLRKIPDEDMGASTYYHNRPYGFYQNGGLTHSQARHFVNALYKTGMTEEGDRVLAGLCSSLSDGTAYTGVGTGMDWRMWDGTPTGYEGYLCDQLGILATVIDRYNTKEAVG